MSADVERLTEQLAAMAAQYTKACQQIEALAAERDAAVQRAEAAEALVEDLRRQVQLANDGWHYADGVAELAMKHRDEAEAALTEANARADAAWDACERYHRRKADACKAEATEWREQGDDESAAECLSEALCHMDSLTDIRALHRNAGGQE